jgi:hypothetical protein
MRVWLDGGALRRGELLCVQDTGAEFPMLREPPAQPPLRPPAVQPGLPLVHFPQPATLCVVNDTKRRGTAMLIAAPLHRRPAATSQPTASPKASLASAGAAAHASAVPGARPAAQPAQLHLPRHQPHLRAAHSPAERLVGGAGLQVCTPGLATPPSCCCSAPQCSGGSSCSGAALRCRANACKRATKAAGGA